MADDGIPTLRDDLRSAMTRGMRARDRDAVALFRAAIAAIDNAEAVPPTELDRAGAIEASSGLGRTEVARRSMSEAQVIDVVRREVAERREAAATVASSDPDAAARLVRGADQLDRMIQTARLRVAD